MISKGKCAKDYWRCSGVDFYGQVACGCQAVTYKDIVDRSVQLVLDAPTGRTK